MTLRTRLDKVVQLRERAEDHALAHLAQARATVDRARDRLARAVEATRADGRAAGPVELWQLDELTHRRALQAVRAAESEVLKASQGEAAARSSFHAARRDREVVQKAQERRRAEILVELDRRERRATDELATLRFNSER